jgi:hypothetical protein
MKVGNFDRVLYNQTFTYSLEEHKLYINNVDNILYKSYKFQYENMFNNNGVCYNPITEKILFVKDGSKSMYQFSGCETVIIEMDRIIIKYEHVSLSTFNEEFKFYKELKNYIRKQKIDKVLN